MKIIDTHTHIPRTSFMGGATAREMREAFEEEGLCGVWIMTTEGLFGQAQTHNNILAQTVKDDLDFFVPFCTLDLHKGAGAAIAELVRAKEELGMKGLKLHPWLQSFSLTHPAVVPVLEKAGQLKMPVLFHDGTPPYATPLQIAAAAEKVPGTTIVLGHAGIDDLYQDAILACQRHSNIYLCCCGGSTGSISKIIEQCPRERILYASDGGYMRLSVRDAVNKITAANKDEELLQKIFYHNPQSILPL